MGFTLIEVLVALAVFALSSAILSAQSTSTLHNRQRLIEQQIALWVAQDTLTKMRIGTAMKEHTEEQQLGVDWKIQRIVEVTGDNQLRKITIRVSPKNATSSEYSAAQLIAFLSDSA